MTIGKQILAIALLVLAVTSAPAQAVQIPPRTTHYVNDYANVIDPADETDIERYLSEVDRSTSNQIVVVTWPSLEGMTAEELTLKFAEAWKPGRADKDNGVVVGVYPNDHEARIEVGYGLEGAIPDAIAATILRDEMIPAFKQGKWAQGIANGVQALAKQAAGEYHERAAGRPVKLPPGFIILILFGVVGFIIYMSIFGRRYTHYGPSGRYRHGGWGGPWGGGGWGGGGGFGGGFGGGGGGFGGGGASGRW